MVGDETEKWLISSKGYVTHRYLIYFLLKKIKILFYEKKKKKKYAQYTTSNFEMIVVSPILESSVEFFKYLFHKGFSILYSSLYFKCNLIQDP